MGNKDAPTTPDSYASECALDLDLLIPTRALSSERMYHEIFFILGASDTFINAFSSLVSRQSCGMDSLDLSMWFKGGPQFRQLRPA